MPQPPVGSHLSLTLNKRISQMATTKFGSTMPSVEPNVTP